jgi:ribosome-associated heat shock protein Hsp15
VRLFRTRSAAAAACQGGKVTVNGAGAKPARSVHPGDVITAHNGTLTRTVKVIAPLEQRVGAALVSRYLEDLTPPAEYEAARQRNAAPVGYRPPGTGRPTKRDRRLLQSFFGHDAPEGTSANSNSDFDSTFDSDSAFDPGASAGDGPKDTAS